MHGLARWGRGPALVALGLTLAHAATAAEPAALTAQTLPLAIRDGRVAQLTVHAVPFALGSSELPAETARGLEALARRVATDCFLTAQAIGHVQPGDPGDGDLLPAHDLARARAETVRAALVRAGLPADAVASVWDYQFSLREPRVTLWLFSLPTGEDCTGAPLAEGDAARPVASGEPPPAPPAERPPAPLPATPAPPAAPAAVEPAAGPPPADVERLAVAEIVFEPNSSYFPRGAEGRLQQLVAELPPRPGYRFELEATVDDGADAAKPAYGRWLAERRQSRIADWLRQHVEAVNVEIRQRPGPHDATQRVVVTAGGAR